MKKLNAPKNDFEIVTAKLVRELRKGRVPWLSNERTHLPLRVPYNLATSKEYSGVNPVMLWMTEQLRGLKASAWATERQIEKLGGEIKVGRKPCKVLAYVPYSKSITSGAGKRAKTVEVNGVVTKWPEVYNLADVKG